MKFLWRCVGLGVLTAYAGVAQAQSTQTWNNVSNVTALSLPVLAAAATWVQGDVEGTKELILSTGSAVAAAEVLKQGIHSTRPDGSDNKSFPSAHTALAFSAATFIDRRYGEQYAAWTPALYGVAALTGVARVEAKKHHWVDVIAGGALGYGSARFWTQPVQGGRLSVLPLQGGMMVGWARPLQ